MGGGRKGPQARVSTRWQEDGVRDFKGLAVGVRVALRVWGSLAV